MKKLLYTPLMFLASLQIMAQAPTVTTNPLFARGATMAFGRATFKANGSTISKRGFCFSSENKTPTIDDNLSSGTLSNNGLIYKMTNLTPSTIYYARAYATAADGSTGYGDVIKIVTLPKGNIGWGYDNGGDAGQNARINAAVEECVEYWNNLTSIDGLYLNVHFGAQTPTADCSYGGWMRVGPDAAYQKTGTIMHEALHAIGVGTHSIWYGSSSPLRTGSGTGQWLGDRATELVRFLDNNSSSILNGDGTHLWPYGINGAQEDNGTEFLYTACSLMAQAVGEDGIPATESSGCASPYYSFNQEDTTTYYIKSESTTYGLYNSYLVEDASGNIVWKEMTAAEATMNDAAKWNVTFTPSNQYYQIRNVSSGKYMSYSQSGTNGIKMVQRSSTTSSEDFQLMRSRVDIKSTAGSLITTQRGYWIIHPDKSTETPGCLAGAAKGATQVSSFNIANSSKGQRWIFLTEEQAAKMSNSSLIAVRDEFMTAKTLVEGILTTQHTEVVTGADAEMNNIIESYTTEVNTSTNAADIKQRASDIVTELKTFLGKVKVTDIEKPFDLTSLVVNPSFDTNTSGWTASNGTWGHGAVEFFEKYANAFQTIKSMPLGTYTMKVRAFQRPGSYTDTFTAYEKGTDNVAVSIWINTSSLGKILLKNIMAERSDKSLHSNDKKMTDGTYVPNTMASAVAHFQAGYYDNEVTAYIANSGDIKLYLRGTNDQTANWTIFDDVRLYYYGPITKDELTDIKGIKITPVERRSNAIYDTMGRYVGTDATLLSPGIYIINGKKICL